MEKTNNAVEKAENATIKNGDKKAKSSTSKKRTHNHKKGASVKNKKAHQKDVKRQREILRQEKREKKEREAAERERIAAEKRVELARIKAHKKAEREKAKATALREKNRRIAEHKAQVQQLKAERYARREMLKNESRKDREKRKREERAAAMADRRNAREQRARDRQKNKERNKGYGGWLAAVITLSVATLALASALTFTFLMPTTTDGMLESTYRKSFYDTVEQVDNIDLNLSKVLATKDTGAMQKYLVDTAINSELAENDLQQLPLHDESKFYTTKLINQIGDYAKYLNQKLIVGEELSKSDMDGLKQLYSANAELKASLQKTVGALGSDYSFSSLLEGGDGNIIISDFNTLQNLSVQYPELIYDGPFSDGQNDRELKGLSGDEISDNDALKIFSETFVDYGLENVKNVGMTSSGFECYNVQGEKDGEILYAQISKTGGKIIMFDYAGSCKEVTCDSDVAIEKAQEFLSGLGIENMKAVWINLSNNLYTVNFAYEQDDVVVYPDLIKVRVCAQTQTVIGMEAKSYYTNHTERKIEKAAMSEKDALKKVSSDMEVESARLSLVPIGNSTEKLCYEFSGIIDGATYYVYIDAITGRQVEMFKVIESTEGTLLM